MKDVLENPDKKWNWYNLSVNPNITMKDIKENPNKEWDWYNLSSNPNIKIKFVKEQSFHDAIACQDVQEVLEKLRIKVKNLN